MKAARRLYERMAAMPNEAAMIGAVGMLKNRDLLALHHYALGREAGDMRDRIMICLLMDAGDRHLARINAKQMKKAKEIL
jgi:hypothetical protein